MNYEPFQKLTLRVSDIQKILSSTWYKAEKVFYVSKLMDDDPYDLRPTEVPTHLVIKALNLDENFVLRQIEVSKKELSDKSSN